MTLVVKSPVWEDLRQIGERITADNPEAADRFFAAVKVAFAVLERHPQIGRLRSFSVAGIRSWVVPEFDRYVIFYLPTRTEVQVLAVLHGARDLAKVLGERVD